MASLSFGFPMCNLIGTCQKSVDISVYIYLLHRARPKRDILEERRSWNFMLAQEKKRKAKGL